MRKPVISSKGRNTPLPRPVHHKGQELSPPPSLTIPPYQVTSLQWSAVGQSQSGNSVYGVLSAGVSKWRKKPLVHQVFPSKVLQFSVRQKKKKITGKAQLHVRERLDPQSWSSLCTHPAVRSKNHNIKSFYYQIRGLLGFCYILAQSSGLNQ